MKAKADYSNRAAPAGFDGVLRRVTMMARMSAGPDRDQENRRQEQAKQAQEREEARGRKTLQDGLRYLHIAFILPAATIMGWIFGSWLGDKFGAKWMSVAGLGLGVVAGFYDLIRSVARMNRDMERDSK